jgi:type III pantothenate kinase
MLLAADVGNTETVFAVHDGAAWRGSWRTATRGGRTADDLGPWLHQVLAHAGLDPAAITGAAVASVVPAATPVIRETATRYLGVSPLIVTAQAATGAVTIRLPRPEELGPDRLANAVAGHAGYGGPLVVVDLGTAVTFDVVGAGGAYEGGVIAPGIEAGLRALGATAALPRIEPRRPESVLGRDTVSAMESGVFWGYGALIDGLVDRLAATLPRAPAVVATGGLAPTIAPASARIQHVDPMLTLDGVRHIHTLATSPATQ